MFSTVQVPFTRRKTELDIYNHGQTIGEKMPISYEIVHYGERSLSLIQ